MVPAEIIDLLILEGDMDLLTLVLDWLVMTLALVWCDAMVVSEVLTFTFSTSQCFCGCEAGLVGW